MGIERGGASSGASEPNALWTISSDPSDDAAIRPLRVAGIFGAVALVVSSIALLGSGETIIVVAAMFGIPFALLSVAGALNYAIRFRSRGGRLLAVLLSLIGAGQFAVGMASLAAARAEAMKSITGANLRGIYRAMSIYRREFGGYPGAVMDLVRVGAVTPRQVQSPFDPGFRTPDNDEASGYSSYAYAPGTGPWREDSDLMLMWERGEFCPAELRIFGRNGRMTLFADGTCRVLDSGEFEASRVIDARRRGELGWPVVGN